MWYLFNAVKGLWIYMFLSICPAESHIRQNKIVLVSQSKNVNNWIRKSDYLWVSFLCQCQCKVAKTFIFYHWSPSVNCGDKCRTIANCSYNRILTRNMLPIGHHCQARKMYKSLVVVVVFLTIQKLFSMYFETLFDSSLHKTIK